MNFCIFRKIRMIVPESSSSTSGYLPSSEYLTSSYRTKKYPILNTIAPNGRKTTTLNIVGAGHAHADVGLPLSPVNLTSANTSDRSATLPSPYRYKYEAPNIQIDSPVGLYNCPQQRTSEAFSSMDDFDAPVTNHHNTIHHLHPNYPSRPMKSVMSSPTLSSPNCQGRGPSHAYLNQHLMNHRHILNQAQAVISHADAACSAAIISQQPSTASLSFKTNSLERASFNTNSLASRQEKIISNLSNLAATRKSPSFPVSSTNQKDSAITNKMMYPETSLAKTHYTMGTLQEVFYHREMRLAAVAANLSPPISTTHHSMNHPMASLPSNSSTSIRNDALQPASSPPPNSNQSKLSGEEVSRNSKEECRVSNKPATIV